MKVSEMSGASLNYWVARAEGVDHAIATRDAMNYRPSEVWSQGGPIIDRERITVNAWQDGSGEWTADVERATGPIAAYGGKTALIAAMRAYVASKFGEEVPDAGI
ncbi:DUF2591 domain-containing protein (plasmid) [Burkholderia vietnamiensis]|uniref:DUF2591 domain-containing protein n=1 Tax=Burkholderia vietnamiensis (strain G4 / LMG 22486) TaxID=269482 RepID=A4JWA2_BURVG|nr:conserved hypothetical protein [Burkholderia vietnamiensis G4]MCB4349847.1 DUF2591 domain-containing protein [Burkholderia vietnamiensis]